MLADWSPWIPPSHFLDPSLPATLRILRDLIFRLLFGFCRSKSPETARCSNWFGPYSSFWKRSCLWIFMDFRWWIVGIFSVLQKPGLRNDSMTQQQAVNAVTRKNLQEYGKLWMICTNNLRDSNIDHASNLLSTSKFMEVSDSSIKLVMSPTRNFSTGPGPPQLQVTLHDGHTTTMHGEELGVFKEPGQKGLGSSVPPKWQTKNNWKNESMVFASLKKNI